VKRLSILLVIVCLLAALPAQGEVIKLRDGSELEGKIVERTKTAIRLKLDDVEISIEGDQIVSIDGKEYKVDVNAMLEERLSSVKPGDADGLYEVAVWCNSKGLTEKRDELVKKTLEINPQHPGANRMVGNVFRNGKWWTPDELKKQGLVLYRGKWMTKDEMKAAQGMVKHMGTWVTKERREQLVGRTFSRYANMMQTHAVRDLMQECMRIELFNRLKLTKEQMEEMFPLFVEAENRRQEYIRRRNEINEYVEEKYLALKEAIMFGVIVSFDKPKEIREAEGPAVDAEYKLKRQRAGYCNTAGELARKVVAMMTREQKLTCYMKYCACCHQMSKCTECQQCHTGQGGLPMGMKPDPVALQALTEVRAMSAKEWMKKMDKVTAPFIRPVTDARSKSEFQEKEKAERESVCAIFEEARKLSETEFEKRKFLMAAQLGACNELERAQMLVEAEKMFKHKLMANQASKGMWASCLFDGTFYNLMMQRLGKAKVAKVIKKRLQEKAAPEGLVEVTHNVSGKALVNRICTQCHTLERVMKARKDAECWGKTLNMMMSSIPEEDKKYKQAILEYLVALEEKKE